MFKKILASLVYGKGMPISEIYKETELIQTKVRSHCKKLREGKVIKGQPINQYQTYGEWAYYHFDDKNVPLTKAELEENTVLDIIKKSNGILTADIQKESKFTQYLVKKTTKSLKGKGKIKHKNIAGKGVGGRSIYLWSLVLII